MTFYRKSPEGEDSTPVRGALYEPVDECICTLILRIEWRGDLAIAMLLRCNTILELKLSHDNDNEPPTLYAATLLHFIRLLRFCYYAATITRLRGMLLSTVNKSEFSKVLHSHF